MTPGTCTADALRTAVLERRNILVGGGTGSGKTTLTDAPLEVVASTSDRVYVVEDMPELKCTAHNKVQVLMQPPRLHLAAGGDGRHAPQAGPHHRR